MVIFIIIVLVIIAIVWMYKNLIKLKNNVDNAWRQIDVQLQRRYDLIPNLVESVNNIMEHEKGLLTQITEMRTVWGEAKTIPEKAKLDEKLASIISLIMKAADGYSELKLNNSFLEVQEELRNTENKIAYSRQFYNDTVTIYNTKLEKNPFKFLIKVGKFEKAEFFKIEEEESKK